MKKRIISVIIVALAVLSMMTACNQERVPQPSAEPEESSIYPAEFEAFLEALDVSFSTEVNQAISQMGDDPVLGFRSAGSPAEFETADYLAARMEEIGLQNITLDRVPVDGWVFRGADLSFTNAEGNEVKIDLGGYQTTIQAQDETIKVVYLGKGTAPDYEGVDVTGKLVLIDIDQNEEWWINWPAYQAHVKGARAVLANSVMPVEMNDRIGTQDICGPDYAPALGISQADTDLLKEAIQHSEDGEIEVVLNADSLVTMDVESANIWGEIPGKTDEVIYMMAHRDGYFHSYFDDASGIGLCMGIAKAVVDSGYQPERTIRFVFHGAEEWGRSNSQADWAIGAYEQITNIHPEWAENAFAIINIDGAYCVEGETTFGIALCEELTTYIQPLVEPMIEASPYQYRYQTPPSTYKEDFCYVAMGVPSVSTAKGSETIFYDTGYHTSADSREVMGFDEDTWLWMHTLYGRILYAFDSLAVRPMDFSARFQALRDSYDESVVDDADLMERIDRAIAAAEPVTQHINALNGQYSQAVADGELELVAELRQEAAQLNGQLHSAYKKTQNVLLHLDQDLAIIFPHENRQENILNLRSAINALESSDAETALDALSSVGNGWYAQYFEKEVVDFFIETMGPNIERTWAYGLVDIPDCPVEDVVLALTAKDMDLGFTAEIDALKELEEAQMDLISNVLTAEKEGLAELIETFNNLI